MDVDALFDKIEVDLAGAGVTEGNASAGRVLEVDGQPFARLLDERMAFRFGVDDPALHDALALETSSAGAEPGWVEVDSNDVSEWQRLAEQALASVRRAG